MLGFMFAAIIVSIMVLAPLADVYGRKPVNLTLGMLLLISFSLLVACIQEPQLQRLELIAALICVTLGLSAARTVVTIVYACELTVKDYKSLLIVVSFVFLAWQGILIALYTSTSNDMIKYIFYSLLVNVITLPLQACLLPESPSYLFSSGERNDFYAALTKLQKFNNLCRNDVEPIDK